MPVTPTFLALHSISVSGGFTLNGISATLDSAGSTTILSPSGTNTVNMPIALASPGTVSVSTGSSLSMNGNISGGTSLTQVGGGTLNLLGSNGFNGGMTVTAGLLTARSNTAIHAGSMLTIGGSGSLVLGVPGAAEPLGQAETAGPLVPQSAGAASTVEQLSTRASSAAGASVALAAADVSGEAATPP